MAADQGSIRQQSDCLFREKGNKRRRMVQSMKRGAGKREVHTERHTGTSHRPEQQHMGGAFSLSLLLLAPMYQIPALETHKPAQLPTSTPRLSFISPFSLMPSFSALFPHRLPSSGPVVVVLLPFVATIAMFPDSINTPALATTSETPTPLSAALCAGGVEEQVPTASLHLPKGRKRRKFSNLYMILMIEKWRQNES